MGVVDELELELVGRGFLDEVRRSVGGSQKWLLQNRDSISAPRIAQRYSLLSTADNYYLCASVFSLTFFNTRTFLMQ